jgi:hypothetical protein
VWSTVRWSALAGLTVCALCSINRKWVLWACHVCHRYVRENVRVINRLCSPSVLLFADFVFCLYKYESFLLILFFVYINMKFLLILFFVYINMKVSFDFVFCLYKYESFLLILFFVYINMKVSFDFVFLI